MATAPIPADSRSPLDRALLPIADVKAGEAPVALLVALNLFLVLFAYYLLKTIRESLILTESGPAAKAYTSAAQAILLLLLVPAFAAFASRVNRVRLLTWVTLFFISHLALFALWGRTRGGLGIAFFLWVGIFNTMGIAQFWSFANDLYTPEQGKRLFAILVLGANLGAWLGSEFAKRIFRDTGPYTLMLVAGGILLLCVAITRIVNARERREASPQATAAADEPLGKVGAFELLRKDRYLLLIGFLVVGINVVNTTGEFLLGEVAVKAAEERFGTEPAGLEARQKFIGEFYGDFYGWFNLLGFLGQTLLVSRIMSTLGVGGALLIHPTVACLGYVSMALSPSLGLVRILKIADNALDYSLNNTAKQALWLPTSREAKYKAKQAVDSFFYRAGDVVAAGVVFVGQRLAFTLPVFAAINAVAALLWLGVSWTLGQENRRRVAATAEGAQGSRDRS